MSLLYSLEPNDHEHQEFFVLQEEIIQYLSYFEPDSRRYYLFYHICYIL